ncbi:hypothetical protein KO481_08990 [Nocardia sp. NEAU-G5]|uniref:Uncharacterized protein n=1 Tax=Nocardia albiluteola TaxID=2842303 RepID=A0ABS6AUF8_9NOCA|nr:hypothetical protein [Nocardia albiluteola]MBU3061659.1 hypothetical protein [Nocardia albiluteola]
MTHVGLDVRVAKLEHRVTDIEESHGNSIYALTRDVRGLKIDNRRLVSHANSVGRSLTLIMKHLGIPPIPFEEITPADDAEIDQSFEDEA